MNPIMRSYLDLTLSLVLVFAGTAVQAQPLAMPTKSLAPLDALFKQCMDARTPQQCRATLSACEQMAASNQKEEPSTKLDQVMDKLLDQLAFCEDQLGQYATAEVYCRQALALRQRVYGLESIKVAESINNLAQLLESQGRYNQAEPLFQQALTIRQKLLGTEHPDVASSLNNLASVLYHQGQYTDVERLLRKALAIRQKLRGAEHPEVAQSLDNLASVLSQQGKYAQAEPLFQQALTMREKLLGPEHLDVALSLNNLAAAFESQGKYDQAERLHQRALAMRQKLLGPEHPDVAYSLSNLAVVLGEEGKYAQAESLFRRALAMRQKLLGPEHPNVAQSLNLLATALTTQGNYSQAEPLLQKALAMQQKLLGPEHPDVALSLNNLATVFERQGKHAEAESLLQKELALNQKILGLEHPDVVLSLNNLAAVFERQGKYAEAEALFQKALSLGQKLLGPEHPYVIGSQHNLAWVLDRQGKYAQAELLYQKTLMAWRKLLGPDNPAAAKTLHRLAGVLLAQGKSGDAVVAMQQAARIREEQRRTTSSETRMLAMLESVREEEEKIYGLLLGSTVDSAAPRLALTLALLRKGRAVEAGTRANRLLHHNLTNPTIRQRFEEWQIVRQQRESLLYEGLGSRQPAAYQARLKELLIQAESLEAQLAVELPAIRSLQPPEFDFIVAEVANRLPQNAALVEVVWTRPYLQQAPDESSRWGDPHYVALILTKEQRITSVDLGLAAAVDARSQNLLNSLQNTLANPEVEAQALYQQILQPLLLTLAGKKELFLSLDGVLNVVPFDALHDGTDYLLGRYRFHYLTSGRDLLLTPSAAPKQPPVLLADPDFGALEPTRNPGEKRTLYQELNLAPLPGTKREADKIGALLKISPLLGRDATEQAVRAVRSPWILHIATHSLIPHDVELLSLAAPERGRQNSALSRQSRTQNIAAPEAQPLPGDSSSMNRSALLLAGVYQGYRAASTAADGLLTAEEARSLDLEGTQLVTLSACETGQGALSAGQGVYGLRRAFLVAGAETLVISLWRVNDEATGELMELYYRKLLDEQNPGDRLDAMTEAMKELRGRKDGSRAHPYYWAPFLVIGESGPLRPAHLL